MSTPAINQLFHNAGLSVDSLQTLNVPDIGEAIQTAMGIDPDDVMSSESVLVTMLIDDSGSISFNGNTQNVIDGYNGVLEALQTSKQKDGILVHTKYLNGVILYPYTLVETIHPITHVQYKPSGGTPLYDQSVILLGTVIAKTQEFLENGIPVKSITLIITDGRDEHSVRHKASDVAKIVRDMRNSENYIVAGFGISDGHTDFYKIFEDMGITREWILTSASDASSIRKTFQVFSQSALKISQGTSLGGFMTA